MHGKRTVPVLTDTGEGVVVVATAVSSAASAAGASVPAAAAGVLSTAAEPLLCLAPISDLLRIAVILRAIIKGKRVPPYSPLLLCSRSRRSRSDFWIAAQCRCISSHGGCRRSHQRDGACIDLSIAGPPQAISDPAAPVLKPCTTIGAAISAAISAAK